MGARARTTSLPGYAALKLRARLDLFARRLWPTARELAFYAAGTRTQGDNLARCAIGHAGGETAFGSSLYGWNVGNIVAGSDSRDWFAATDTAPAPAPGGGTTDVTYAVRFRWYHTLRAGLTDYILAIAKPRYSEAWAAALEGSPSFLPLARKGGWFVGRSRLHAGETVPRVDTDAELEQAFTVSLELVGAATPSPGPARRIVGGAVLVGLGAAMVAELVLR